MAPSCCRSATLSLPATHAAAIRPPALRWILIPGTSIDRPVGSNVRPSAALW